MSTAGRAALVGRVLEPRAVAVVGASDDLGKFGARVFDNALAGGFAGALHPINPKRDRVNGVAAHPRVSALPAPVDLAVIAVPRPFVLEAVRDCANAGTGAVVIITSGFSETGPEGARLQDEIVAIARAAGMGVIGPNCLGLLNTHAKLILNSSPAMTATAHPPGGIAFISQSGALLATVYNRGVDDGAAFSVAVSIGNQADLTLADFVDYLADHEPTRVITLYVEGFQDARAFMAAARRCRDAGKPVLLLKAGRTAEGARVAFSHTASLASDHRLLAAACRDAGIILVDDITGMIQAAEYFSRFGPPEGDGIGVLSPSGGAAAVVTDRMQDIGLRLASFGAPTRSALEVIYQPAQLGNPLDLGWLNVGADAPDGGTSIIAADPDVAALLFPITTSPRIVSASQAMAESAIESGRPFSFVMLPGSAADEARAVLKAAGALVHETMNESLSVLATWIEWLAAPPMPPTPSPPADAVRPLAGWPTGRVNEPDTKRLLAAYGIAVTREVVAVTLDEAVTAAAEIGYPVVLKGIAGDLVHKSDSGAVHLDLADESALTGAWEALHRPGAVVLDSVLVAEMVTGGAELLLGVHRDPQFGPVMMVGWGGVMVELLDDVAVAALPVDATRARHLLEGLRVWPVLGGIRGRPGLDVDAVVAAMLALSRLALDAGPALEELEMNPLIVLRSGAIAVDARARFAATA